MFLLERFSRVPEMQHAFKAQQLSGPSPWASVQLVRKRKVAVSLKCLWFGESQLFHQERNSLRAAAAGKGFRKLKAGLEEIANNQVLHFALTAGILAQLVKPFTGLLLGKGFNWRVMYKSGGMPSSHSASITAAATVLGLERGLSDSVFGFAVVVAGIVMYDAQGVRNAAGKHAKLLNSIVVTYFPERLSGVPKTRQSSPSGVQLACDLVAQELEFMDDKDVVLNKVSVSAGPTFQEEQVELESEATLSNGAFKRSQSFFETVESSPSMQRGEVVLQEIESLNGWEMVPLKETIGHTKPEVLVGGFFGVIVTLALHSGSS